MIDYINPNTFRDLGDFVIMLNDNKPFTTDILKQDGIIYCKRDYIDYLFQNLQFASRNYVLITGASDFHVTFNEFQRKPKCIKKWYAQNVDYAHPDLIPIPIGVSPDRGSDETPLDIKWFFENLEKFKSTKKSDKILYCNWTTQNNPKQRGNILEKLQKNDIEYTWEYPTITDKENEIIQVKFKVLKEGKSTKQEISKLLHYYEYIEKMSKYKFVVSPPGNGIDCHRTWEALYMGAFPIVIKGVLYNEFSNLPIIQVNDYSEITYDLLNSYIDKEYDYEKLYMNYWKKIINDEIKK